MSIGLIIATVLLLAVALAVRQAGSARILNFVQYDSVTDRSALHLWVGNRLLGLAAVTGVFAFLALRFPGAALFFLLGFIVSVLLVLGWLVAGSSRFHARR